jgi:hypothetical protein
MLINFKGWYCKNIIDYDIRIIYIDLLKISENYSDDIIKNLNNYIVSYVNQRNVLARDTDEYMSTLKYLMINKYITLDVSFIAKRNDLDFFIKCDVSKEDLSFYEVIAENSYDILEYMFHNPLLYKYENLKGYIIELYDNFHINLNITKLIFKNIILSNDELLDILEEFSVMNDDSFAHLLNLISEIDSGKLVYLLTSIYNNKLSKHFVFIYNKFGNKLLNSDIIFLYDELTNEKSKDDEQKQIITYLANLEPIKEKYLYPLIK